MPFSLTRYAFVLIARSDASLPLPFSELEAFPTRTSVASELCCKLSATSSRQAFPSLSTRTGRRRSRSNFTEHISLTAGMGGGAGAATVTEVVPDALPPLSSATLHVTETTPSAVPAVARVAVEPDPLTDPEVEL